MWLQGEPCFRDGAQACINLPSEQWRLRHIYIRNEDNERFLAAFAALSQLAFIVDAKLHLMFALLNKDLFDELVKIVCLWTTFQVNSHNSLCTSDCVDRNAEGATLCWV